MDNNHATGDDVINHGSAGADVVGEPLYELPALSPEDNPGLQLDNDESISVSSEEDSDVDEAEKTTVWGPEQIRACLRDLTADFERYDSEGATTSEMESRRLAVAMLMRDCQDHLCGVSSLREKEGDGNEDGCGSLEERVYSFVKVWHTLKHSDGGLGRKVSKSRASQHLKNARKRLVIKLRNDGVTGRHSGVVTMAALDAGARILTAEVIAELRRKYIERAA